MELEEPQKECGIMMQDRQIHISLGVFLAREPERGRVGSHGTQIDTHQRRQAKKTDQMTDAADEALRWEMGSSTVLSGPGRYRDDRKLVQEPGRAVEHEAPWSSRRLPHLPTSIHQDGHAQICGSPERDK